MVVRIIVQTPGAEVEIPSLATQVNVSVPLVYPGGALYEKFGDPDPYGIVTDPPLVG